MTSRVLLTNAAGEQVEARAMLDSGAAISVLSSRMMGQLQLKKSEEWMTMSGVESTTNSPAKPTTNLTVSSFSIPGWSASVKVVILPKATVDLPRHDLTAVKQMPHLQNLSLADPCFHQTRKVDLILDSDIFDEVLLPEKISGPPTAPSAWKTKLGWGVMGRYVISQSVSSITAAVNVNAAAPAEEDRLDTALERFWSREELPQGSPALSPQERDVEKHFSNTHYFSQSTGRYVVTLPKTDAAKPLGESRKTALQRFIRNEQSLLKKGTWTQFQSVVQEYLTLGHAQRVTPAELCTPVQQCYYMPMHAVFKSSSTSTKLRVVFDASCPSTTGVALSDILAVGPTLHPNLDTILIRFRSHRVALSSDVGKMYREVELCQSDRQLHRFLWRPQPDQPVADFCMNRVTFGVTSSPYVAVKTLQQAADDFSAPGSLASWHVKNSFYVDDFLGGADSAADAISLYYELRGLLLKGGFELKKWRSSSAEVLDSIPSDQKELLPQQEMVDNHTSAYPKTLGIAWDSRKDVMAAQVQLPEEFVSTKRGIISDTARSFDILGWLAPFIINMKVLFQLLWKEKKKIGWDDSLEEGLASKHREWREQLPILKSLTLPRCYFSPGATTSVTLHGFSDASEAACAAAVYIRATYADGSITCRLVVAKTRVAPIKTLTIPRLELCAAEMLAELLAVTRQTLNVAESDVTAWSDSTIALAWLRSTPSKYKTCVANRIASAARNVPQNAWLHVPTAENPADCASRGISAQELRDHPLWWEGPLWLHQEPVAIPPQPGAAEFDKHQNTEAKPVTIYAGSAVPDTGWQLKFHSYTKLLHTTAYILRFCRNLQAAVKGEQPVKEPVLSPSEVKAAELALLKKLTGPSLSRRIEESSCSQF